MKKIFSFIGTLLLAGSLFAQDAANNLALCVYVEDMQEPFPAAAKVQLTNRLNAVLTQNGIASTDVMGQFFLTAFAIPQTKDVIAGPPMQFAENMEITFYIADYQRQLVFATTTITTRGVGTTEPKSYMAAIRQINPRMPQLAAFVEEGKTKIVNYYNAEAAHIIAQARVLAGQKEYEQALWILSAIPVQCTAYDDAAAAMLEIYQMHVDYACYQNLQKARMAWAAEQNADGAVAAGEFLAAIYPDAACYGEAMGLYAEIKGKVLADWQFEMKQYQDGIDLEKQRIEAARAIGVAYGSHQQPVTTNVGFLRGY